MGSSSSRGRQQPQQGRRSTARNAPPQQQGGGQQQQQPWVAQNSRQPMVPNAQYQHYLFHETGIRPEIAFMPYPLPRSMPEPPPRPPPPEMQQTTTVRNDVNLKKATLVLEPRAASGDAPPTRFGVTFKLDAAVPCECRVFFVAHEHVSSDNLISFETTRVQANEPLRFPAGLGQEYKSPSTVFLDVSSYEAGELVHVPNSSMFPLVVQLSTSVQAGESPQSQYTYATLVKSGDTYSVKVLKQKIQVGNTVYELQEIYGIDQQQDDIDGKECVICMSEEKDTTVLPCRHMCLCSECAKQLRYQTNKCPICRTPVESLLQIKVSDSDDEQAAAAADEEDLRREKKKKKKKEKKEKKDKKSSS